MVAELKVSDYRYKSVCTQLFNYLKTGDYKLLQKILQKVSALQNFKLNYCQSKKLNG